MTIILLIFALFVAGNSCAVSNSPSEKKHPSYEEEATKVKQGTKNNPVYVQGEVTTYKSEAEAQATAEERKEKSAIDASLVKYTGFAALFTGLLFVSALIQIGLFVWQLRLMRKAVTDSAEVANAAKKSADAAFSQSVIAEKEFISTHRPKLILRDAFCNGNEIGDPIEVTYVIVNIGETPARIVESAMEIRVITTQGSGFGAHPRIAIKGGQNEIGDSIINPGEGLTKNHISNCKWRTDDGSRHDFLEPYLGVFFCGDFAYEDDRKIKRHTMFWRKYDLGESRFYHRKTRVIA